MARDGQQHPGLREAGPSDTVRLPPGFFNRTPEIGDGSDPTHKVRPDVREGRMTKPPITGHDRRWMNETSRARARAGARRTFSDGARRQSGLRYRSDPRRKGLGAKRRRCGGTTGRSVLCCSLLQDGQPRSVTIIHETPKRSATVPKITASASARRSIQPVCHRSDVPA